MRVLQRERERERERLSASVILSVCVCVFVCMLSVVTPNLTNEYLVQKDQLTLH